VRVSEHPYFLQRIKDIQDLNTLLSDRISNPRSGLLAVRVAQIMNPVKIMK
jgi:hypothetical protein